MTAYNNHALDRSGGCLFVKCRNPFKIVLIRAAQPSWSLASSRVEMKELIEGLTRKVVSVLSKLLGVRLRPDRALTKQQKEILQVLLAASARLGSDGSFTYQSEWLGWLPYGQYHWVNVSGKSVSNEFPSDWDPSDLDALVAFELAERVSERTYGE
jgi:hypothetical protein